MIVCVCVCQKKRRMFYVGWFRKLNIIHAKNCIHKMCCVCLYVSVFEIQSIQTLYFVWKLSSFQLFFSCNFLFHFFLLLFAEKYKSFTIRLSFAYILNHLLGNKIRKICWKCFLFSFVFVWQYGQIDCVKVYVVYGMV